MTIKHERNGKEHPFFVITVIGVVTINQSGNWESKQTSGKTKEKTTLPNIKMTQQTTNSNNKSGQKQAADDKLRKKVLSVWKQQRIRE
jgi:hypothetical protein